MTITHIAPAAHPATLRLQREEVLRFQRTVLLSAVRGRLWATVDDNPDDIVLNSERSHAFDGRRRVLASPLGCDALIGVMPQAQAEPRAGVNVATDAAETRRLATSMVRSPSSVVVHGSCLRHIASPVDVWSCAVNLAVSSSATGRDPV